MLALLKYSVMRLALFVAVLALLVVFGMGQLWAIVVAALVSMMISYVFLRDQRDAVTREIEARIAARGAAPRRVDPDAAHEDAVTDAAASAGPGDDAPGDDAAPGGAVAGSERQADAQ